MSVRSRYSNSLLCGNWVAILSCRRRSRFDIMKRCLETGEERTPGNDAESAVLPPFVSVIIPFYNDHDRLRKCLDALTHQSYQNDRYEILVVDNGSEQKPDWIAKEFPTVRVTEEQKTGSYAARNRGISLAVGEVLAFTDSDCIPEALWLREGVRELTDHRGVGLVGGCVEFMYEDPSRPTAVELYDSIRYMQQRTAVEKSGFAVTANMFTSRNTVSRVGVFDDSIKSGGDKDWGQRVISAGFSLAYSEKAVVRHPARRNFSALLQKSARLIGGYHDRRQENHSLPNMLNLLGMIAQDLTPPVRFAWRLARDRRVRRMVDKVKVLGVFVVDKYYRAYIRIRLSLGETSSRM